MLSVSIDVSFNVGFTLYDHDMTVMILQYSKFLEILELEISRADYIILWQHYYNPIVACNKIFNLVCYIFHKACKMGHAIGRFQADISI